VEAEGPRRSWKPMTSAQPMFAPRSGSAQPMFAPRSGPVVRVGRERGLGGEGLPGSQGESPFARIGLSRAVYPADDRRTAVAHLERGVAEYVDSMIGRGYFPAGLSQEAYFARSHIHYGHPEEVVASLRADRVFPLTTDLIVQVHPGHPTPDQFVKALERIAKEVAPPLGWRPRSTVPSDRPMPPSVSPSPAHGDCPGRRGEGNSPGSKT